jgi:predicted homoserine dehydrogenase-like protein
MIFEDLQNLESDGKPIRVGVSGAGWIGSGFVRQVNYVPGMVVNVLADSNIGLAHQAFVEAGLQTADIVEADQPGPAMDALRQGKRVITGSYALASQLEDVDIVADITPSPAIGAETAYHCIQNRKDVVMVNIEADCTVGRILKKLAIRSGVLYTVSSGDEPGCLMELWDFVNSLGYQPIVIGKGKNNPLDRRATPDTVVESARKADKDPFQVASYVDGSKTMFEMTCAANATGCRPMRPGMIGPEATLQNVSQVFAMEEDGGITTKPFSIDFVQGSSMSGGVFITVKVEDPRIRADLEYLKVGKGYYYTFFRPYHLWFLEAPISVAKAHLYRQVTLAPLDEPVCDSIAFAKRDLKIGETLDDFGGYTFYGVIHETDTAGQMNALPAGLAPGARVAKPVASGQPITWDDVKLDEDSLVVCLRRQQDSL